MFAIGIDIGGTKTRIGLVEKTGNVVDWVEIPTDLTAPPEVFIRDLFNLCSPFLKKASSIGIGIAGQTENGILHSAPNLGWKNVDLLSLVRQHTPLPLYLDNDVRMALYGEWRLGAGKGIDNLLMIALGTGLGGAAIVNGTVLKGAHHSAGELGHTSVHFLGRECTCGNLGCVEAYAGGWALQKFSGGLSPEEVFRRAERGNVPCAALIDEAAKALSSGMASFLNIFNPQRILFAGSIFLSQPLFLARVMQETESKALPTATKDLDWRPAVLSHPAVIGAALASAVKNK